MHLYSMKRLLVCTDFSEASDVVLKAAENLRAKNGGSIHLLHVSELGLHLEDAFHESLGSSYKNVFLGNLKESLEKKMATQLGRCNSQALPLYKDGKANEVILDLANSGSYDLIVMGHSRGPILSQIIGSTAYKTMSSSPIPVFIVKDPLRLEKVAALIDESRPMDRLIIGTFDFHFNFKCSDIHFISLWLDFPEPFGNPKGASEVFDKIQEEVTHFATQGVTFKIHAAPTRELKLAIPLEKILKETKIDVAVLKRYTEGNLKRAYLGSTTKRLLEIFDGNILILPPL